MMIKWIRRIRNSLGYGVQSPNDFFFVQHVLREETPYYSYDQLHEIMQLPTCLPHCSERVCRLLFRLANHVHPQTIVEVGTGAGYAACAMTMGSRASRCITIDKHLTQEELAERNRLLENFPQIEAMNGDEMVLFEKALRSVGHVDMLRIAHTPYYREMVDIALPYMKDTGLLVIEDIDGDDDRHTWWQGLQERTQASICYDLNSMGLLFFDSVRYVTSYWVALRK